jgi:uncharacterized protein (TIGR03437 family)
VNVTLPAGISPGNAPVTLSVGGVTSSSAITVAVQ